MDFWHTNGGAANWAALLAEPDELTEIKLLRRCTHAGAPIGSSEFLDLIQRQLGHPIRPPRFAVAGQGEGRQRQEIAAGTNQAVPKG
jgi:hypothetical protein